MPTTTNVPQVKLNIMTQNQYNAATKSPTELYMITDAQSVDIDDKSITTNSSDELQTVGVIDQRNTANAIKTWTGTKAQYDAISTKDANTIYNITDDTNPTQALLEAIYPVGSIYIGTMNVCPMSALFGTWQLVSTGKVLQGSDSYHTAGTSISAGLPNITGDVTNANIVTGNSSTPPEASGAFKVNSYEIESISGSTKRYVFKLGFDASESDSIYGNSTTVQPPAYVVNIWERTA